MAVAPRVGLFVTCLVDLYRPNVGFAAIRLLEQCGCEVIVPENQTCCGQPAYNSGDNESALTLAKQTITAFEDVDYIVAPSGSCASMIREHYPSLFANQPNWAPRAGKMAERTYELVSFLVDIMGQQQVKAEFAQRVTYHDSCSGLRELKVHDQPRALLASVTNLSLVEMDDTEVCCGFGGTFSVKFPDISERMVTDKCALAKQTKADVLLGGDLGCLMNISGRFSRLDMPIRVYHVAEILANMTKDVPAIGEAET